MLSEQLHSGGFDPRSLQDIINIMGRHDIPVPPTFTLLARALVTLEGTLRVIDPQVDLATAAAAHLGALDGAVAGDRHRRPPQQELLRSLPSLRALPGLTEDVALQLRSGRVRLQVDAFSGPGSAHLTRWMDQAMFTAVAARRSAGVHADAGRRRAGRARTGDRRAAGRRLHRPGHLLGDADAGGGADPAAGGSDSPG